MPISDASLDRFITSSTVLLAPTASAVAAAAHLDCPICQATLCHPVACSTGEHVFCRACLDQWINKSREPTHNRSSFFDVPVSSAQAVCPIDRIPLTTSADGLLAVKAPKILFDIIDDLDVICSLGCGWSGKRGRWREHLRVECSQVEEATEGPAAETGDGRSPDKHGQAIPPALVQLDEGGSRALIESDGTTAATRSPEVPVNTPAQTLSVAMIPDADVQAEAREALRTARLSSRDLGACCDCCDADIFGERYKCLCCQDFDLCSACWTAGRRRNHSPKHGFVRITDLADYFPAPTAILDSGVVHFGINCDGCHVRDIPGIRYHCLECDDFDYCENCINSPDTVAIGRNIHHRSHEMLRMTRPTRLRGSAYPMPSTPSVFLYSSMLGGRAVRLGR